MISLGMIVRNCEATLEKCLESVAPYVDEIVIGLGGESTDRTEEIARKFTDNVFQIEWHDNFSEARNLVLSKITGDYYLWLDGDDELIGGESLRALTTKYPQVDAFYWGYDYSRDENGSNNCYLVRERLIKLTSDWKWIGAVHEVMVGPADHLKMLSNELVVKHHPQNRDPERNLQILYSQLRESEPNPDPRILVYLGTENASRGNFKEAILHLHRFIRLTGWDEEKYQAQHRTADIYRAMGQFDLARQADFEAISIRPEWADAYLGLAETAYHQQNFRETIEWTKAASTKVTPNTFLVINPRDYDFLPLVILGLAYAQIRDYEMAVENFKKAIAVTPDPKVIFNLKAIEDELDGHKLVDAFNLVWQHLSENDEWLKARRLFDSVPKLIEKTPPIQKNRAFTLRSTAHVDDPALMVEDYRSNPYWAPMADEAILDPGWLNYPRMAFALDVVKQQNAKNVLDFGCSDGFITLPLARELPDVQVSGIDLDPRCVALANERVVKWGLQHTDFQVGDATEYRTLVDQFYDVGIAFEIIEHVVDPNKFLDNLERSARHIALTTPHLAWQSPAPNWDQEGFKGHLRIFDLLDIEALLSPRGQIYNLYQQRHGGVSSWIFADYKPGEKSIGHVTILAPGTPEAWSPLTFRKDGLGGSETAVIKLSEAIAKSGYQVSVFSRMSDEGYFNRVRYREQERYMPDIRSDLFIAWRAPELIDDAPNAAHSVLWMHDTDAGDRLTPDRAAKFENIVVLTNWHKEYMLEKYPFLESEKLIVIPNGVDLSLFGGSIEKNQKKVIYSSSPDRGLDYILEHIWPSVIEQEPEAELHIYYGWNNLDRYIPTFPQLQEFKNKVMDLLAKSKNVVQHGRISQSKLAKEMMSASIWLYPTYFTETYCITAIEAQLAGCWPITNDLAALAETVKSGDIIRNSDLSAPDTVNQYIDYVVKALRSKSSESSVQLIKDRAPAHSWDEVAYRWIKKWLESDSDIESSDLSFIQSSTSGPIVFH
jgi:2-polyprenyl-3-methyl-5-hydroxy-6-metoxy-1,4-benzoquinol methylase/glycosyltransferase involved in cell wall biosynthesis